MSISTMARKASVTAANNATSRHARVKEILNRAAGASTSDYGAGRFWDGDVQDFKQARVHGVLMIAPETAASCCDDGSRSAVQRYATITRSNAVGPTAHFGSGA
jgi:hypothetical protein